MYNKIAFFISLVFGASLAVLSIPMLTNAQSVSANTALGSQNAVNLNEALGLLGTTLNQTAVLMSQNQINGNNSVNSSLSDIRSTLIRIQGNVALLDDRARGLAQNGSPGLPNTGGGGGAH